MADYHKLPDTLPFEFQSPPGSRDGEFNVEGYGNMQNTAVFCDTMVLDGPVNENETQLENLLFDTEVVNNDDDDDDDGNLGDMEDVKVEPVRSELDKETVPDSEDEGSCEFKAENFLEGCKTTGRSERKVGEKREVQSPCLDADSTVKQFGAGKKGSIINYDSNDEKKDVSLLSVGDREIGKLEYTNSEEPKESSQAAALSFVDNFLALHNVDISEGVEERKSASKKSPIVTSAKGTQRLAKIIKQGSPVTEMGTFEWYDSYEYKEADSFSKGMTASYEFGDFWKKTNRRRQNIQNKGKRSLINDHEENKEFAELRKGTRGPSHSHSSFMEQGSKVSIKIEEESERNIINGSVKEFDKLMQTDSSLEKFEDIPDTFDVGISTQIAAEAMEALYYDVPPGIKAVDTCEGLEENGTSFPEGEISRIHLDHHSLQNIVASHFEEVAKKSIRRKRSARRCSKDIYSSSWNCNNEELNHTIKPKTYKSMHSKIDESVSSNNLKACATCESPSIPSGQTLLRKQLSWEDPVFNQSRHCEGGATMEMTKVQPDQPRVMANDVKEGSLLTYKRKRKRVVADPPKLLSGKQKCSELHSYASAEALDGKLTEKGKSIPQEAATAIFFRLDAWNSPKGKRTHHKVPIQSSGESNMHAPFTSVGAEEQNLHSVQSKRMPENDEITTNNFNKKGQMHTALSRPSLEKNSDESLSRQNCSEQVKGIVANSDSAVTGIRTSALEFGGAEALQTGKRVYVNSKSIINGLRDHTIGKSLRKSIESSVADCKAELCCTKSVGEASLKNRPLVYQRRSCNKKQPKASLMRELMQLGVPESLSDFSWKGLRKRKEMAFVRVLFSQHLDDGVIKQQKKITARLGISITSCSMDATHFIADKFVRTRNMLEAIALGKPVVTHLWLESCGQSSCLLDEKNYILRDTKKEKEIGFSMDVSLARARQYPLLKDKRVCITQNVKPNKEMISSLVKALGGEVVETSQKLARYDQKLPENLLILSCEQDLAICAPLLEKAGAAVYSSELLLNGIVIQKLEYERHQLFAQVVKEKGMISEWNRHSKRRRSSKHGLSTFIDKSN